jgi:hypothetical protein
MFCGRLAQKFFAHQWRVLQCVGRILLGLLGDGHAFRRGRALGDPSKLFFAPLRCWRGTSPNAAAAPRH